MKKEKSITKVEIPTERIAHLIFLIRGKKVMFDRDLAGLYNVGTRDLNKAVRRNIERFPADFMFQLSKPEFENLMFQFGTSRWGGTRKLPYVFTEHGVTMLSSVLKSKRAIEMNISVIRSFIKLREMLSTNKELAQRMDELEREQKYQGNRLESVYAIVKQLIETPIKSVSKIGFNVDK